VLQRDLARAFQTRIGVDGANDRFGGIGEERGLVSAARATFRLVDDDEATEAKLRADDGAGLAADQRVQAGGEFALAKFREALL
jgi:hypothetical protein